MLYISTSVWVLRTPNAGWNSHFHFFFAKKLKKSKKYAANFCKKHVFLSLHQNAGPLFCSQKMSFLLWKHVFTYEKLLNTITLGHFWVFKTVDQRSGAKLKKHVFYKNLLQICCFFAEKSWTCRPAFGVRSTQTLSKYTTYLVKGFLHLIYLNSLKFEERSL